MPRAAFGRPAPVVTTFRSAGVGKRSSPLDSRPATEKELATIYKFYLPIIRTARDDPRLINNRKLESWMSFLESKNDMDQEDESIPRPKVIDLIRHLARNRLRSFHDACNSPKVQILSDHPISLSDEDVGTSDIRPERSARQLYDEQLSKEKVDALTNAISHTLWSLPEVKELLECEPDHGWPPARHWSNGKFYPMQVADFILGRAMQTLTDVCYDFMRRWMPLWVKFKEIEYPEALELPVWLSIMYEMLALRRIPQHALKIGYTIGDARQVMNKIRELRNHGVHGNHLTPEEISSVFQPGILFADMCMDYGRRKQLERLSYEINQGPEFLEYLAKHQEAGLKKEQQYTAQIKVLALLIHNRRAVRRRTEERNIERRLHMKRQFSGERIKVLQAQSEMSFVTRAQNGKEGEEETLPLKFQSHQEGMTELRLSINTKTGPPQPIVLQSGDAEGAPQPSVLQSGNAEGPLQSRFLQSGDAEGPPQPSVLQSGDSEGPPKIRFYQSGDEEGPIFTFEGFKTMGHVHGVERRRRKQRREYRVQLAQSKSPKPSVPRPGDAEGGGITSKGLEDESRVRVLSEQALLLGTTPQAAPSSSKDQVEVDSNSNSNLSPAASGEDKTLASAEAAPDSTPKHYDFEELDQRGGTN